MSITMAERLARLDAAIEDGRLVRHEWARVEDGRELVCLLAALAPEVAAAESAEACPAGVMPAWLAEITPWMDDAGSDDAWPGMVRRYAGLARRWCVLDAAAWSRVEVRARVAIVREAMRHTDDPAVLAASQGVIDALEGRGDLAAAREAAREAASVPAWASAAEWAAWAAAEAWAAEWAAASAAEWAAEAAEEWAAEEWAAAAWAAEWAAARAAVSAARAAAASWAAADRITVAVLDAIEGEIARAEVGR